LKRIVDTVHFAEKADARPLQLADLCAFLVVRLFRNKEVPEYAAQVIARYGRWIAADRAVSPDWAGFPEGPKVIS
jgi:hypothetical protein